MTTFVLGAHRPLGLACVRQSLASGGRVLAGVQAPHRVPPALGDLRDEYPTQLTVVPWTAGAWPSVGPVERVVIAELPIPPAQSDEADDPASDLRALSAERLLAETPQVLDPTLAALQFVTYIRPVRVLIQATWLGVIGEKIRGGGYALGAAYAAQLMMARIAALDLQRAGIAAVVGNAGRYKVDISGPDFHADIDEVARGLLAILDRCQVADEPEFRDWRGGVHHW